MILIPKNDDAVSVAVTIARQELWNFSWALRKVFYKDYNNTVTTKIRTKIRTEVGMICERIRNSSEFFCKQSNKSYTV